MIKKALYIMVVLLLLCGMASAAQLNVNVTGWWHDGGAFNASGTPIQTAVNNAIAGDTVYVWNGTYTEGAVDVITDFLTLEGESTDVTFLDADITVGDRFTPVLTEYATIKNINSTSTLRPEYAHHSIFSDNKFNCITISNDVEYPLNCTFLNNSFATYSNIESIKNSIFNNNIFNCLINGAGVKNNTFTANTFYVLSPAGLYGWSSTFQNNTFSNSIFLGDINVGGVMGAIQLPNGCTEIIFIDPIFEYAEKAIYAPGNQQVNVIQTDNRVFIGNGGHTIANTTATNLTVASGSLFECRPFWITPSTGELNITATPLWNTTDDYKKQFNISGTSGTFTYTIGDMLPNADATITTDTWSDTKTANSTGYITGTYNGGWGDISFSVYSHVPIYYTTLLAGWNLIGSSEEIDRTARDVGTEIGANCFFITQRNKTTGYYETHFMEAPPDESNFYLERGWGYYVFVISETLWGRYE